MSTARAVSGPLEGADVHERESGRFPRCSIIIPLHRDNATFRDCLRGCLALDYPDFEVIVVSDRPVAVPDAVRLFITGHGGDSGPGEKRDVGVQAATGTVLAFIDDDAVPRSDWLTRAVRAFDDPRVGAVGGPGMTPPASVWRERLGGAFYESWLGSGPYRYRFRPGKSRMVDDYPAYNLCIRRDAIEHVDGWGSAFYGGEDTVICLAMVRGGWDIVYDPDVVVFHRRRPVLRPHLRQVGNVGKHRGYFVKRYTTTSLRPAYFLPMIGTLGLAALAALALVLPLLRGVLAVSIGAYALVAFAIGMVEQRRPGIAASLVVVIVASHLVYGLQFARGLMLRTLTR